MKRLAWIAAGLIALVALVAGALVLFVREDHEAAPREEQVYDDFGFRVVSAERADGRLVLGLEVANHARRVPFHLGNYRLRLVDAGGEEHEERVELVRRAKDEIAPGETIVETHVFEIPASAHGLVLELGFGAIPDALDWLFLGKRTWRLP